VTDILEQLDSPWPANFVLQPLTAEERHDVIEIQDLKKSAAKEIRLLQQCEKVLRKIADMDPYTAPITEANRLAVGIINLLDDVREGKTDG
jgi:hypothetical protein